MFNPKKFKFLQFLISQKPLKGQSQNSNQNNASQKLTEDLKKNIDILKRKLGTSPDIVYHEFTMGTEGRPPAILISIDGLVEKSVIYDFIIKPLMIDSRSLPEKHGIFPN